MAISRTYQPPAAVVAGAGFQAGLGNLRRFLQEQLQQRDLTAAQTDAQARQQLVGNANQRFLQSQSIDDTQTRQARDLQATADRQAYGVASDHYLAAFNNNEQTKRALLGYGNDQVTQARGIEDVQTRQGRDLEASAFAQTRSLAAAAASQANELNFREASQVYGAQAQKAQQILGGQINGSLATQDAMLRSGLSDQSFEQQQALAQQAQLDRLGLGDQDFAHRAQLQRTASDLEVQQQTLTGAYAPTFDALSSRQLQQQQQQLQQKAAALAEYATSQGASPDVLRQAQAELKAQMQGLSRSMLGKNTAADRQAEFESNLVYWDNGMAKIPMQKMKDGSYKAVEDPTQRFQASAAETKATNEAKMSEIIARSSGDFMAQLLKEDPTHVTTSYAQKLALRDQYAQSFLPAKPKP